MSRTMPRRLPGMEDNRVDPAEASVNEVDRLKPTIRMAKMSVGAALEHAIGDAPLKTYGDKGLMSKVVTGDKVPEYLARIWLDRPARRRLAFGLLDGDPDVAITTTITVCGTPQKQRE